jgi:chromate transport protein ChrA
MSERIKIVGLFAILGFVAGILANFAYHTVLPTILAIFPEMLQAEWMLSGIAGAILTILVIVLWAYLSGPRKQV